MISSKNNSESDFLSQGSYGCVFNPGIDCNGKKNKKKTISKLQELNFFGINEVNIGKSVKKIKNYKKFFAPIIESCKVSFDLISKSTMDIKKCDTLFEDYFYDRDYIESADYNKASLKKLVKDQYLLIHIDYINSLTMVKYFMKIETPKDFFNKYLNSIIYLSYSIIKLNNINIVHNDLHYNNILFNLKNNNPIVIDFGLSYNYKNFFGLGNTVNINYIRKFFMDYRIDSYHHNLEKRFISFITYNKISDFKYEMLNNNERNYLTQKFIDYFIEDSITTIKNNSEISFIFTNNDFIVLKKEFKKHFYQFLDVKKYPLLKDIVIFMLKYVLEYEDLYKLIIDFIHIYYKKRNLVSNDKKMQNIIFEYFKLFKFVFNPDPEKRFTKLEFLFLVKNIYSQIQKNDSVNFDTIFSNNKGFYSSINISSLKQKLDQNIFNEITNEKMFT